MKTVQIQVYKFNELNEDAKQKAIEWFLSDYPCHEWWDGVYEDAKQVGIKINGFDIDRGSYCKGEFIGSALDTSNKIIQTHGESCETYKTAIQFEKEWSELVEKYSNGIEKNKVTEENEWDFDNEAKELEDDFLRSILEDYRIILSKEYDFLTSEEHIIECLEINGYEFTEDGKIF